MNSDPRSSATARRSFTTRALMAGALATALVASSACSSSKKSNSTDAGGAAKPGTASSTAGGTSTAGISAAAQAELTAYTQSITAYPTITSVSGAAAALKGKKIWFVPVAAVLPFMSGVASGLTAGMTKLGATVHVCDGKFLPTSVASCLEDAAQQGADAVVSGYNDYSLVPNAFDALVAKHIPVLIGGEAASGGKTDSPQLAFYDTIKSQETLQRLVASSVIKDSGGKAKVLFLGETDSKQLSDMTSFTKDYYKQNCPGCTLTEIDFLSGGISKLPSQVSAALISHPDTNYVHLLLDPNTGVVLNAIQNSGKSIKLATEGGGLDSLQRVGAGKQMLDVGVSGVYTGWQFADGLVRMMTGSTPVVTQTAGRLFTKDNVSSLQLTPSAYATNEWYGDNSYITSFSKAWGIG